MKTKIKKLSKTAREKGKRAGKKTREFLATKEGKALVKAVVIAVPLILEALPPTKKIKMAKKLFQKIF